MADNGTTRAARLTREIEFHRRIAGRAESVWDWESPAGRRRAERRGQLLADAVGLKPGVRALELGCGTGLFLEKAAAFGAHVLGVDLSEELLREAGARVGRLPNVRLTAGNAESLPCPDASFDAVYGSSILHHLDLAAALRELYRVLRPGGRLAFAEPNLLNPQILVTFHSGPLLRRRLGMSPDEMAFTRFRSRQLLQITGFTEARVQLFDFLHPAVPARAIAAVCRLGGWLERLPLLREIAGSQLLTARKG